MATRVTKLVTHYSNVSKKLRSVATQLKDYDPKENEVASVHSSGNDILSCVESLDKMMQLFENKEFAGVLAENIGLNEFEEILDQISAESQSQQLVETDDIVNKSETLTDDTNDANETSETTDSKNNNDETKDNSDDTTTAAITTATATATTEATANVDATNDKAANESGKQDKKQLLAQIETEVSVVSTNENSEIDCSVFENTILSEKNDVNQARIKEIWRSYNHLKSAKRDSYGKWKVYAQYRADRYSLPFRETGKKNTADQVSDDEINYKFYWRGIQTIISRAKRISRSSKDTGYSNFVSEVDFLEACDELGCYVYGKEIAEAIHVFWQMATQFTNDIVDSQNTKTTNIKKSDSSSQIEALHSLEQENSGDGGGGTGKGGGKNSKGGKGGKGGINKRTVSKGRGGIGGSKDNNNSNNELSKTWREVVSSNLALLYFLPLSKVLKLSFVQEWIKIFDNSDNSDNKDGKDDPIENLKRIVKNGKKTIGQWTYENAVYAILYDLNCDEVEAIRYYLCAKDKIANLIDYQYSDASLNDMSTLLHRSAVKGYLRYTKILVKHGAKLDTVNKFDNMPIELAQDNVKEYLKLCKMGGTTREQIEESSLKIRQQNSTIDTFFNYLGINMAGDNSDGNNSEKLMKQDGKEVEKSHLALEVICETVLDLLNHRMPISDDLMLIVWKYLHERENKSVKMKDDKIMINKLIESCRLALRHDNPCKARDLFWFKKYIMESNIWLQKIEDNNDDDDKKEDNKATAATATATTTEDDEDEDEEKMTEQQKLMREILGDIEPDNVLFSKIEKAVEMELLPQKEILSSNIEFCMNDENEKEYWNEMINFNEFLICDKKNKGYILRQDYLYDQFNNNVNVMKNGVLPDYSDRDLDLISANIDVFDVHHHYDTHNYLSKLLINAHKINPYFQSEIKQMFGLNFSKFIHDTSIRGTLYNMLYQEAPVKLQSRCQAKAENDYNNEAFPTTACIVDPIRCSLTFDSCKDLIKGLNHFINKIKTDGESKDKVIKKIVRIKNMFKSMKKNANLRKYCDIKINVIIEVDGVRIIGEVQFLLKWMLQAKVMGHSIYGVLRRKEYIDNVNTLSKMYSNRKQRVLSCLSNHDANTLGNEILFDDLFVLSISDSNNSILEIVCHDGWYKGFKIIFSGILHRNLMDNQFAETILNKCAIKGDVSDNSLTLKLWGLDKLKIKKRVGKYYKILKELVKCKYVNICQNNNAILWYCCLFGAFQIVLDILISRKEDLKDRINEYKYGLTPLQVCIAELDNKITNKDLKLYYQVIEQFLTFENIDVNCQIKGQTSRFTTYKVGQNLLDIAQYRKDDKLIKMLKQRQIQ